MCIKLLMKCFFFILTDTGQCFLETEVGMKYGPVFSNVRWHHVINDMSSIKMIENDQVLPIGMTT